MYKSVMGAVVITLVSIAGSIALGEDQGVSIRPGIKVWAQDASYQNPGQPEKTGDGTLWGPVLNMELNENLWLSAIYLTGDVDYKSDWSEHTEALTDAEMVIGWAFKYADVGAGFRYYKNKVTPVEIGEDYSTYGPMIFIGAANSFGSNTSSPLGWYAGLSWMFSDMSSDDTAWSDEHYNFEPGLFYSYKQMLITVGYRYKSSYDFENDLLYKGFTASLSYKF
jgi:hypothetical protein